MDYRPLGRTGVQVSKLCLGTMMFGAWGNTDHDDSIRIVHRALDAGVNFVDTADVDSAGESEEIVSKALKGRRDDVVLATGQGPLHRLIVILGRADRRGTMGGARAAPRALSHRAAALLAARSRDRARRTAHRAAPRHGHPHLQPARRRLAVGYGEQVLEPALRRR